MITCLNCGHAYEGKYCSACGQKAGLERFTVASVLKETFHFFTHFEKGFLHTLWGFIAKPGTTALNYLHGKRKQYQSPVGYLFICTGLYIIVHDFIINHYGYHIADAIPGQKDIKEQGNILLRTHFTPFYFLILLISAFIIYLVLARRKFDFIEIFITSLYGGGTYMIMLFVSDIILGFIFKINIITPGVFLFQTLLSSLYNFWFCFDFFTKVKPRFLWLKLFITAILVALLGYILFTYLPLVWLYYFK